ncbi:YvcK family protein [Candidatus Woesearchaeota archaeon]|nr:YvcK family protein [Candidatus Woesearchaeota archaeon]
MAKPEKQRIVVIGGGTGSYTVLRGLKKHDVEITAVVSMMDSGGSAGKLRDEYGYLPQGDMRRCLIALSEDSSFLRKLFEYRFEKGGVGGHSLGNLLLTAIRDIAGNEKDAIIEASRLLSIKGRVIPVTLVHAHIGAVLENGQVVVSETNIDIPKHNPDLKIKKLFIVPKPRANPDAVKAILEADKVVIGPGDLYTSVLANVLISGIKNALTETKAKKIFVCNIMNKYGETTNFSADDFLKEVEKYAGKGVLDCVLLNDKKPHAKTLKPYEDEGSSFIMPVLHSKAKGSGPVKVVKADLLDEGNLARHDSDKLADVIVRI